MAMQSIQDTLVSVFHCTSDKNKYDEAHNDTTHNIRIVGGSCIYQHKVDQPLWKHMNAANPDLVLLLGDNVYLDQKCDEQKCPLTENLACFNWNYSEVDWYKNPKEQYDTLLSHKDFIFYNSKHSENNKSTNKNKDNTNNTNIDITAQILLIWDDHDYGKDNATYKFPHKTETKNGLTYFWTKLNESIKDNQIKDIIQEISAKNHGVFWCYDYNKQLPDNKNLRMRVIGLDSRWYKNEDDDKSMLGSVQKEWLQNKLESQQSDDVDFYVFLCGTNMLTHLNIGISGTERWPKNDEKWFYDVLNNNNIWNKSILISGDVHYSVINEKNGLYEIVTSSMTHSLGDIAGLATEILTDDDCSKIDVIAENNFIVFDLYKNKWVVTYVGEDNNRLLTAEYYFQTGTFKVKKDGAASSDDEN